MRRAICLPALVLAAWCCELGDARAQPPASATSRDAAVADDTLTAVGSIRLVDVSVQGNTVFSAQELADLTAPLEN